MTNDGFHGGNRKLCHYGNIVDRMEIGVFLSAFLHNGNLSISCFRVLFLLVFEINICLYGYMHRDAERKFIYYTILLFSAGIFIFLVVYKKEESARIFNKFVLDIHPSLAVVLISTSTLRWRKRILIIHLTYTHTHTQTQTYASVCVCVCAFVCVCVRVCVYLCMCAERKCKGSIVDFDICRLYSRSFSYFL